MDQRSEKQNRDPIAVTGFGHVVLREGEEKLPDVRPYLRVKKNRKFMAKQDILATVAAGKALESSGLMDNLNPERTGLFLTSGYIPYQEDDLVLLRDNSTVNGQLSMEEFSTSGMNSINPLMTFKCLPNMPAFHISFNFDIQGNYMITYPGPGEYYMSLDEACFYLRTGILDVILVSAVADQRNFLVTHHYSRIDPPVPGNRLADASGCLILEREEYAKGRSARIYTRLTECEISYTAHNPLEHSFALEENFIGIDDGIFHKMEMGPARLPVALSILLSHNPGNLEHELRCRNGFSAKSTWEI